MLPGRTLAAGQTTVSHARIFLDVLHSRFHLSQVVTRGQWLERRPMPEGGILRKRSDKGGGLQFVCLTLEPACRERSCGRYVRITTDPIFEQTPRRKRWKIQTDSSSASHWDLCRMNQAGVVHVAVARTRVPRCIARLDVYPIAVPIPVLFPYKRCRRTSSQHHGSRPAGAAPPSEAIALRL